jgi:tetratricopeptide (TPR) repeat protein
MSGMTPGTSSRYPTGGYGAGAPGAGYANRNQGAAYPNAGAAAAGAGYANRNQGLAHPDAASAAAGAGYANRSDWYHGGWNGNYGGYGGYGGYGYGGYGGYGHYGYGGYGVGGVASMSAMGSWAYGPSLYNMGYSQYSNPFYGSGASAPIAQASPYNYAQPIDTTAAAPQQSVTDEGTATFAQARDAFKAGDYAQALSLCDQALKKTPNDRTLHEFRRTVLFALKRYDEAAAALYAVLSSGPGWDWTTMSGLYPSTDVYTGQLRTLEAYSQENPSSAAARFVLGYLYTMTGANNDAVAEFEWVAKLQPSDTLAAKLARMLSKGDTSNTPAPPPSGAPAQAYNLVGRWSASPVQGTTIALNIGQDGPFTWKTTVKGKTRELGGKSSYANGLLTLEGAQGPPLVGKVTWQDENHFTFQVEGGGTLDPGLNFAR